MGKKTPFTEWVAVVWTGQWAPRNVHTSTGRELNEIETTIWSETVGKREQKIVTPLGKYNTTTYFVAGQWPHAQNASAIPSFVSIFFCGGRKELIHSEVWSASADGEIPKTQRSCAHYSHILHWIHFAVQYLYSSNFSLAFRSMSQPFQLLLSHCETFNAGKYYFMNGISNFWGFLGLSWVQSLYNVQFHFKRRLRFFLHLIVMTWFYISSCQNTMTFSAGL